MEHTLLEKERMHQMLLSLHFALGEFLSSGIAIKYGIDNTPTDPFIIIRLMMLCEQVLEPLRLKCGITTKPADTAKKFTANNITGMRVIFQPAIEMNGGKRIKTLLKGIKAEDMTEYQGLKDADDDN